MNIDPLNNSGSVSRSSARASSTRNVPAASGSGASDEISLGLAAKVRAGLEAMPEVRPEVVERGIALRNDPRYPSPEIVWRIAGLITPLPEA